MCAGRFWPPGGRRVIRPRRPRAAVLPRPRVAVVFVFAKEIRQSLGLANLADRRIGLHPGLRETQRLGQPARAIEQPLGLPRHVGFLQMLDEPRRLLALRFAHGLDNADLRNPAQIVLDGRPPAGGGHVEIDGAGELVAMCEARPGADSTAP